MNIVEKSSNLSREKIREEQEKDDDCMRYRHYDKFWVDKDGILYYQKPKEQPRVVIPATLISTVLKCYHQLTFTAHQGVHRTIEFINKRY